MLSATAAERLPDVRLTTHRGEPVRVVTDLIRGRVVLLNFMYARCDGSCPGTSALLQELRPKVTAAFGPDARIVSITLDPAADTPAALAEYADLYGAKDREPGQADWVFLTGPPADVDRLRRALGLADPDPAADADKRQHAAVLTIGNDRTNRWSAHPVGVGADALWRTVLRVAGTTPAQRYGPAAVSPAAGRDRGSHSSGSRLNGTAAREPEVRSEGGPRFGPPSAANNKETRLSPITPD
jgi:protein SCO1/2